MLEACVCDKIKCYCDTYIGKSASHRFLYWHRCIRTGQNRGRWSSNDSNLSSSFLSTDYLADIDGSPNEMFRKTNASGGSHSSVRSYPPIWTLECGDKPSGQIVLAVWVQLLLNILPVRAVPRALFIYLLNRDGIDEQYTSLIPVTSSHEDDVTPTFYLFRLPSPSFFLTRHRIRSPTNNCVALFSPLGSQGSFEQANRNRWGLGAVLDAIRSVVLLGNHINIKRCKVQRLFSFLFFFSFLHLATHLWYRDLSVTERRGSVTEDLRASPKVSPLHVPSGLQNNSVGTRASFLRRR